MRNHKSRNHLQLWCILLIYLTGLFLCTNLENWRENVGSFLIFFAVSTSFYTLVCITYFNRSDRATLKWIFLFALIIRAAASIVGLTHQSTLTADLYRYLWEGKVVAAGKNPYLLAPNASELDTIRSENFQLWKNVDHKTVAALYPPLTQVFFAAINGSEAIYRIILLLCELMTLILLARWLAQADLPAGRLALYAFSPIPIFEISLFAHLDGLMLPGVVLAAYMLWIIKYKSIEPFIVSKYWSIALYSSLFASLIKQTALVVLALVIYQGLVSRRVLTRDLVKSLVVAAIFALVVSLPFILSGSLFGSLGQFSRDWRFNAHLFYFLEELAVYFNFYSPSTTIKIFVASILLIVSFHFRSANPAKLLALVYFLVFMLSPVRYPWYSLIFYSLATVLSSNRVIFLYLSSAILTLISYSVWRHPDNWEIDNYLGLIQFLPLLIFSVVEGLKKLFNRGQVTEQKQCAPSVCI